MADTFSVLLDLVGLAARLLLENGAETYRVEETVQRICESYGYPEVDAVALLTGVVVSVKGPEGTSSVVRRVRRRALVLARVNAVNDLSRGIAKGGVTAEEALSQLHAIERQKNWLGPFVPPLVGLSAGFFALLFGGGLIEFCVASLCGLLAQLVALLLSRAQLPAVFMSLIGGLLCSAITMGAHALFELSPQGVETILSGAIIPLISGLMMTSAVRDTLHGDLLSGLARGVEALLIAIMVALGISFLLGFYLPPGDTPLSPWPAWHLSLLYAGVATMCYCSVLAAPPRAMLPASLLGALAFGIFMLFRDALSLSETFSLFLSSTIIAFLCGLLARRMRMIATIFLCVALVPLVPGVGLYRTMRALLLGEDARGLTMGLYTLLSIGAIAIGTAIGSLRKQSIKGATKE